MSAQTISELPVGLTLPRAAARSTRLPGPLKLLLLYLAAITIFGKGPTYIGIEPVFWGEVVLGVSLLWAARRSARIAFQTAQIRVLTILVCIFITLGAIEAARDFGTWGFDTLRDSAVWYYGLFYFVGIVIASSKEADAFLDLWKLFWIVAIPWGVANFLTGDKLSGLSPVIARFGAPVLSGSGSETAQSIGLGCLLLLSDDRVARKLNPYLRWIVALAGFVVTIAAYGRGARIAVLAAFLVAFVANSSQARAGRKFRRRLLVLVALIGTGAIGAIASGVDLIGAFQLDRFEGASLENPDETAEWRTVWWQELYAAVMEKNPVFGLGFGQNMADYSPYLAEQDTQNPVRSPHNYNMTVFSRMGISGTLVWAGILGLGLFLPCWTLLSGQQPRLETERQITFWAAALVATWVNSSFGVLMEGPVLGIPFWLVLGLIAGEMNRRAPNTTALRQARGAEVTAALA